MGWTLRPASGQAGPMALTPTLADPGVVKAIDGRPVRKVIVRAPKLVNVVV